LASEGLGILRPYRTHFPPLSLYSDGMFWYELFQVINAAGGRVWQDKDIVVLPDEVVRTMGSLLVEVSWFSTATGGDIQIRNLEALASALLAFGSDELEEHLQRMARRMRVKRVSQFVNEAMKMVTRYRGGG
jgi:hypothetical protein